MKRGEKNRAALVAAAARLFWRQGYDATSLADIAKTSSTPLGNVYYYFRAKADFAMAVAEVFVAETGSMLSEIENDEEKPRERLALLVARLARSLKSRVAHGRPMAVRDFSSSAPEASKRAGESFSLLIGFIARELGRTGMRPSLAFSTARGVVSEWQGGMMLAFALKDATVLSESFRRMERMLL